MAAEVFPDVEVVHTERTEEQGQQSSNDLRLLACHNTLLLLLQSYGEVGLNAPRLPRSTGPATD